MKSLQLFLLIGLLIGCESDPCKDVACGPGDCFEGICNCPDGFSGVNCEIESDILCVNGELANGACNCFEGYEGSTCETEIRDRYIDWWDADVWTTASQIGGTPVSGFLPTVIKLEKGSTILEVEFTTIGGAMLVSTDNRIKGQVTENTITFEPQNLLPQGTVYGSANLDSSGRILSIELYVFNPATSLTEEAKGAFIKH